MLSGRVMNEESGDPENLRKAVRLLDVDVLALQEVDRHQTRSGGVDQTAIVAEEMGAECWRFVPALVGTPGQTWRAAGPGDEEVDGRGSHEPAAYGIAIVSRLPVLQWRVVRLRPVPTVAPVLLRDDNGKRRWVWVRDEPRTAVIAVVETAEGPVTVANTHLSFIPGWNAAQLRRLVSALGDDPRPQLLVGDLNMPGKLPSGLCREWKQLANAKTWPAHTPRAQLDHVLGRGQLPPVVRSEAVELPLSDHRALCVELDGLRAATGSRPAGATAD
nr:endonuclease/exonuclease/phosphatase family protein [Motilibacter aurantiacus]